MATVVTIDLDRDAAQDQVCRFTPAAIHGTFAAIREAAGDPRAIIHVRRDGHTVTNVPQTLEDFSDTVMANTTTRIIMSPLGPDNTAK